MTMRGSIFWGSVLIVMGGLFLLDNFGMLPVPAWSLFWPLALIGLGALTLYGVMRRNVRREMAPAEIALAGATRARVRVQHGAGVLRVHAGANPGVLFIDRLSPAKKQSIKRRLRELEEEFEAATV
jgi:hypothetical protein